MNNSDARPIVTGIENIIKEQRKRLDSIPIITGIGDETPKDDENVSNTRGITRGSKKRERSKVNCHFRAFYGGKSPVSKKKKRK